jgi:hypothetical protein
MFYNGIITIDDWLPAGEYEGMYPKGARVKSCYISPGQLDEEYSFLKADHYYLFKESNNRYPWQFWIEIIAYRLGKFMNIEVPPVYIGYKSGEKKFGALIEWFYEKEYSYYDGSMVMKARIENYDTKKGTKHNLKTILDSVDENFRYVEHWAKILLFDSITGNNDRHQDNWGIAYKKDGSYIKDFQFSPAFDNGTSMGHEILEEKFIHFNDKYRLNTYLLNEKARHHMKYNLEENVKCNFNEFMKKYISEYPLVYSIVRKCLDFNFPEFEQSVYGLTDVVKNGEYQLTVKRMDFILMLLRERIKLMKEMIEKI